MKNSSDFGFNPMFDIGAFKNGGGTQSLGAIGQYEEKSENEAKYPNYFFTKKCIFREIEFLLSNGDGMVLARSGSEK